MSQIKEAIFHLISSNVSTPEQNKKWSAKFYDKSTKLKTFFFTLSRWELRLLLKNRMGLEIVCHNLWNWRLYDKCSSLSMTSLQVYYLYESDRQTCSITVWHNLISRRLLSKCSIAFFLIYYFQRFCLILIFHLILRIKQSDWL